MLDLFQEDAEIYFPKFGFGFGRNSFLEMVKGFEGTLEYIQHDYDRLTFIPSGDYLVVEGTSQGRMSGKSWQGETRLLPKNHGLSCFRWKAKAHWQRKRILIWRVFIEVKERSKKQKCTCSNSKKSEAQSAKD